MQPDASAVGPEPEGRSPDSDAPNQRRE
jgi:hypothetical protein